MSISLIGVKRALSMEKPQIDLGECPRDPVGTYTYTSRYNVHMCVYTLQNKRTHMGIGYQKGCNTKGQRDSGAERQRDMKSAERNS